MSGANAISGITLAGAFLAAGMVDSETGKYLGTAAVAFATVNVVGGYMVTDRMLGMFKSKKGRWQIMNIELLANLSYIVSAALFIFGLKMLGSPATAQARQPVFIAGYVNRCRRRSDRRRHRQL